MADPVADYLNSIDLASLNQPPQDDSIVSNYLSGIDPASLVQPPASDSVGEGLARGVGGLEKSAGGLVQATTEAPIAAIQQLATPEDPNAPWYDKYIIDPAKADIAKVKLASTILPALLGDVTDPTAGQDLRKAADLTIAKNTPANPSLAGQVAEMVPGAAGYIAGGLLGGVPGVMGMAGAQTYGDQYSGARDKGQLPNQADTTALPYAGLSAATAAIPVKTFGMGESALAHAVGGAGGFDIQNIANTIGDLAIHKLTDKPDMTWDEAYTEAKKEIGSNFVAANIVGALGGGAAHLATGGAKAAGDIPAVEVPAAGNGELPQQVFNAQTGQMEDAPSPAGAGTSNLPAVQTQEIIPPGEPANIPATAVNNDPSTIYQPTPEQSYQASVQSAQNQVNTPLLGSADTATATLQKAQDLRAQSLDNLVSQLKTATSSNLIDDTNAVPKQNQAYTAAVNDFYLKNQVVNKIKDGIGAENTPIAVTDIPNSNTDNVKANLDAIATRDPAGLQTPVLHDLIDNGFVKINDAGHPEMTSDGKQLHQALQPVLPEAAQEAKALPSPDRFPSGVIAADNAGNARSMNQGEIAEIQRRQQQAEPQDNLGLTPDVQRAQEARNNPPIELQPVPDVKELPSPHQFPANVTAVDFEGNARPMNQSEVAEAQNRANEASDTGLTPDVAKAQADRAAGEGAGKQFSLTSSDPVEAHLADLEREHDSLPDASPRKDEIVKEMNDIVEQRNAAQPQLSVTDEFSPKKQVIANQVTNIIRRINPDVDVKLVKKMFGEGEAVRASGGKSTDKQEVAGSYEKLKNLVTASLNTKKWNPIDTAYHEAYHSVRDMINPNDDAILKKAFPGTDKLSQEEHEAVQFGKYMTEKNAPGFTAAVKRVFGSIKQALTDIGNSFRQNKFNSVDDIFNRVERGSVYKDYVKSVKDADVEKLKASNLSPDQQRQAVHEASPALYDAVYKAKSDDTAFKRWFGDSKVVDKNGDPLTVYHGSPNDFDQFMHDRIGTNGTNEGKGFYFTDSPEIANGYGANGKRYDVNLSIENPLNYEKMTLKRAELEKFIKKIDPDGQGFLSNYGDTEYEGYNKVLKDAVASEYKSSNNDVDLIHSILNATGGETNNFYKTLKEVTGRDGIIVNDPNWGGGHKIYVAFDPKQIKSIDNHGSYDPNDPRIQYSNTPKDEGLDRLNKENNGTPTEKLTALASNTFNKAAETAQAAKEKMLRASVEALRPIASEGFIKEKLADVENTIAKTARDTTKEKSPVRATENIARMIVTSNDGRARWLAEKYKSPTLARIADMFYGGEGENYHEEMGRIVNTNMNQMARAMKGLGKVDQDAVTKFMQHPELLTAENTKSGAGRAASVLARMVQNLREELKSAGYETGEVEGFFPRIYDTMKVAGDESGFKKAARLAYLDTYPELKSDEATLNDMVNRWHNNLLLQDDGIDSSTHGDFTSIPTAPPGPSSFKSRTLSKAADDIMRPYLVQDPVGAMSGLIYKSARKSAWERRFGGDKWPELKNAMIKEGVDGNGIRDAVDIIKSNTGQLGMGIDPKIKNALSTARYYGSLRYLPKVAFIHASLPLMAGMHTGRITDSLRSYVDTTRALLNTDDKIRNVKFLAEQLGLEGENAEHMLLNQQVGNLPNQKLKFANDRWFDRIGITKLVSASKTGVMRSLQSYIGHLADDIANHSDSQKSSAFITKAYGVPEGEAENFAKWVQQGGGKNIPNDLVLDRKDPYAVMYQTAMRRAMDQVIQNPTAATRQMYATHPVGSMIYSLGAYKMAYMKNVLQRAGRMSKEALSAGNGYTLKDRLALAAPALSLPLMTAFAAAYEEAKDAAFPPDKPFKGNKTMRALDRSEVFGQFDGLADMIAASNTMKPIVGPEYQKEYLKKQQYSNLGGPNVSLATDLGHMMTHIGDLSHGTKKEQQYEARQLYDMVLAPAVSGAVATYSPYAIPAFAAIQAVNSPQLRRAAVSAFTK